MESIWGAAIVFLLSFLGLILVVGLIFFLWLAYRYNISFSIESKGKTAEIANQGDTQSDTGT